MPLLRNISTLATCSAGGGQDVIHPIRDAALVWGHDDIVWLGREDGLPVRFEDEPADDAGGGVVIPGLVDCHTHLAFGGWRAEEFTMRCRGTTYLEIADRGGGIASTMRHTREATEEQLLRRSKEFLAEMAKLGITTVECKSGYGLTVDDELKQLRVYQRLKEEQPVGIISTFLGAHIVPPEFQNDRTAYIDMLCEELIPQIATADLAEFCDVFVESSAFEPDEARRIFSTARMHGLQPKLHADQLSDGGGAALAAEVGAASADHLEYSSDQGIAAMAEANVVAVNLPLATLYLNEQPMPARRFIDAGVAVAVATDFNPGSAPSYHLPLALLLACTRSRMTPAEVLKGATLYAARAIGQEHRIGSLEPGKQADFVILDAPSVDQWLYHFRPNSAVATYVRGRPVYQRSET